VLLEVLDKIFNERFFTQKVEKIKKTFYNFADCNLSNTNPGRKYRPLILNVHGQRPNFSTPKWLVW